MRADLHALGGGRGAGGQRLRRLLDLHEAHAAVGGDRQLLVIAEVRHVDAELVARHPSPCVPCGDLHRLAVDFEVAACRRSRELRRYVGAPGSCLWSMWCWNSSRKCLMKLFTGSAAASPSAQIVRPGDVVGDRVQQVEVLVAALRRARCGRPCATASRCLRGTACTGRTTPRSRSTTGAAAIFTMQRVSSITITAPEPSIEPALAIES